MLTGAAHLGHAKKNFSTYADRHGIFLLLYISMRIFSTLQGNFSWSEMDWDEKGYTSMEDLWRASDIGKRELLYEGKLCVEYYSYKDGLPIKLKCSQS